MLKSTSASTSVLDGFKFRILLSVRVGYLDVTGRESTGKHLKAQDSACKLPDNGIEGRVFE